MRGICYIIVDMHIVENKSKSGKKIYRSILLRESYREEGKVKKRTIANLSNCTPQEIEAIKLALSHKEDLSALSESVELQEGLSVGAVWSVYRVAKELGIEEALGKGFEGKLALWQVMARVIDQGSRLSAVRLAQVHAGGDVLDMNRGFDENNLYDNLAWLSENQEEIERKLFELRRGDKKPKLFLYDVTSSYLERGGRNYFGEYGYNRDGKKGKKQIVIGMLCDEYGEPVSTEVFAGNTQDPKTFESQVKKVAERFGCKEVTIVGDRGMIKTVQIERLPAGFHYITAITKPQIESLINKGILQLELFEEKIREIKDEGMRYILRRNPTRAEEMAKTRISKLRTVEKYIEKNCYLREHPKASVSKALDAAKERLKTLKLEAWVPIKDEDGTLKIESNEEALKEESYLDGCYVIKTDLKENEADKYLVHDRYKDLTEVEKVFRECKTVNIEVRPVYVRKEESARGHVFVLMLAYMIIRRLRDAWAGFDLTVEGGLEQLATICSMEVTVKGQKTRCQKIPRPRQQSRELLEALQIKLPEVLPSRNIRVVTRKNFPINE